MDVISHAIWGRHLSHRHINWKIAAAMGVLPDLFAFVPSGIISFSSGEGRPRVDENTVTSDIPAIGWELYKVSHSLVWTFVLFLLIWGGLELRLRRSGGKLLPEGKWLQTEMKPRTAATFLVLPWAAHILLDIPSHTLRFFPTPFLMPFSDFMVDGIRWGVWWVWGLNVIALIAVWWLIRRRDAQSTAAMASIAPLA